MDGIGAIPSLGQKNGEQEAGQVRQDKWHDREERGEGVLDNEAGDEVGIIRGGVERDSTSDGLTIELSWSVLSVR